jgi:ribonuclease P protein component
VWDSLKNKKEIKKVIQQDNKYISNSFIAFSAIQSDLDKSRLGIIVTKKIGTAVVRNRCKRQLRHLMSGIALKNNIALVFIVRDGMLTTTFQTLKVLILKALKKYI